MQTDPTIKKVGEVLDLKKKYKLLYPHNLFWLMYGSFIIIFYLVFPKRIAYILCRIVYGAAGAICLFIAIVAVYMIITEGDSIIADVKSGNWE